MKGDLVTMLRKDFSLDMKHEYPQTCLTEYEYERQKAADRIEKLEAALREIAEMTEGYGRSSELLVGIKLVAEDVLEGKDD